MPTRLHEEVFEQLKGELEAIGVPEHLAERRATRQLAGAAAEGSPESDDVPALRVVPVSRGWMVIRRFAASEAELFDDRESALARARDLADPVGAAVIVHGADGSVEEELTA